MTKTQRKVGLVRGVAEMHLLILIFLPLSLRFFSL
uniref:Uncharacterized protein n=1 Tax=Arundo donax TaxID=35708 RepID=A0A0A9HRI1_ARUDO